MEVFLCIIVILGVLSANIRLNWALDRIRRLEEKSCLN
jgi:hypothetical protein